MSSTTSTEGQERCGSCLQWVGTNYDGDERPYRRWTGDDGRERIFCADSEACERRWEAAKDARRYAAAEARIYFPEPEDEQ
jgi:hypothetical protein